MNYILFDGNVRNSLLPLTYTRPVADIRIGILTIREKWEKYLNTTTTTITEDYLADKYPMVELDENILINASFLPDEKLVKAVKSLKTDEGLFYKDEIIAFCSTPEKEIKNLDELNRIDYPAPLLQIKNTWDIFRLNGEAITADFNLLTRGRTSAPLPQSVAVIGDPSLIFLEDGVDIEYCILNTKNGPIYLGKNTLIMEGSMIRGPYSMLDHSVVKMGAKIYGPTSLGPKSKVGGEVNNVVMSGYCSKGHEGYLGNAVIGEWCNLGADTNNSNLKNTYANVKLWSYETEGFTDTGLQFCGLIMGDHSKSAINTMFNTGTVVGVSSNIYGSNFPRNFIPSFSWGGAAGMTTYQVNKAIDTAKRVMERKNEVFTDKDEAIFRHIFELTQKFRKR